MAREKRGRHGRRSPVWTRELEACFLAILKETGNARTAIRALGHGPTFYRRRREDPGFARSWAEAVEAADLALRSRRDEARSPFPARPAGHGAPPSELEPCAFPEPAAKARSGPEPVIRRNRAGRLQLAMTRPGDWTSDVESRFLAHLRRSGAFLAAARAVGFHFTSIYERIRQWPAFARAVEEAVREADVKLEYALVGHAHALVRRPDREGGEREEAEEEDDDGPPFDPALAMKILAFIDSRRNGGRVRGRRKGPPERTFEEAVSSILGKIEAIERHEKLVEERRRRSGGEPGSIAPGADGPGEPSR